MVPGLINKYLWLLHTIIGAGERGLPLEEICRKYEGRFDTSYSRRTFNNHRAALEEVFGVKIDCNRSTNRYFIPYGDEVLDHDASVGWLINTFTVNSLLTLGKERLTGRVSVEEIPSGQKHLTTILQAMQENHELEISYRKYSSAPYTAVPGTSATQESASQNAVAVRGAAPTQSAAVPGTSVARKAAVPDTRRTADTSEEFLHVQPFAVKEHEKRWYLVGFCRERAASPSTRNSDMSAWRVYGLDRIQSMRVTARKFKMPGHFDVEDIFRESYGIYFPQAGRKPVTIRFRATAEETQYIRDLPLHRSQKMEPKTPSRGHFAGGAVFRIRVIPNRNLIMEFCRHGNRIEVLEPASVRTAVAEELLKASQLYSCI